MKLNAKILAAMALATAAPALAQGETAAGADGNQAAKSYADRFGVSIGEATRRLQLQRQASRLQQRLRTESPDTFAGLYIDNGARFRVVARFKGGGGDDKIKRHTQDADLLSATEAAPAAESFNEIRGRQQKLIAALKRAGVTAESSIDIRTGVVRLLVLDKAAASAKLAAANVALGDNAVIEQVPSFVTTTATLYGGYTVATQDPNYLRNCTSGFNVVHFSTGVKGIITAGHCYNQAKYFTSRTASYSTTGGLGLTFKAQADSGNDDYQWFTASSSTYPAQFYDGVSIKSVTDWHGWTWPYVGEWVCKYGITTLQTCGEVKDTSYWDSTYQGYYVWVSNTGEMNKEGDSGGPVFVGTEAYGIVHGRNSVFDLFFMPLDLQTLGLEVLIQP